MISKLASGEQAAQAPPQRSPLHLVAEPRRVMTAAQELTFLQQAHATKPTPASRQKLAKLLIFEERLTEAHQLLTNVADLHANECLMLASCCLQLDRPDLDREAAEVAHRVFSLTEDGKFHSAALAFTGKVLIRQGDLAAAQQVLQRALELDPANLDACKRLAFVHMKNGDDRGFAETADLLARKGVKHCRLFAAQVLSLARNGQREEAQDLWGFDRFAKQDTIAPPAGWSDLEAFNSDLAEELLTHPGMRFDRIGSASNQTWRVEHPLREDRPAIAALADLLIDRIVARSTALDAMNHPWITARPDNAFLRMWSVITDSDGFEDWHVHQFGWMSGVYYVRVPQSISAGNSDGGCLKFGLPDDLAGSATAADFGHRLLRPRDGLMTTFPSHVYHRTFPHATGEKRICVGYDVRPID
jgi:tetratricopeptide (TPR) repeat protein